MTDIYGQFPAMVDLKCRLRDLSPDIAALHQVLALTLLPSNSHRLSHEIVLLALPHAHHILANRLNHP